MCLQQQHPSWTRSVNSTHRLSCAYNITVIPDSSGQAALLDACGISEAQICKAAQQLSMQATRIPGLHRLESLCCCCFCAGLICLNIL